MHEALESLQDVYYIADDILVVGQGDTVQEANRNHDLNVLALNGARSGKEPEVQPTENSV